MAGRCRAMDGLFGMREAVAPMPHLARTRIALHLIEHAAQRLAGHFGSVRRSGEPESATCRTGTRMTPVSDCAFEFLLRPGCGDDNELLTLGCAAHLPGECLAAALAGQ